MFVLHNLYPCPLLYRLCDKNGFVSAEGVLPVGASLPLFRVSIRTKQYLSVRLANYLWSTFTRVHSPKTPYPVQETVASMEMKSLHKMKNASDNNAPQAMFPASFDLPTQIVNVSLVGRHIRLYAKLAVVNRSNVLLDYKDGSMAADVNLAASNTSYFRHAPLPVEKGCFSTPAATGLGSPTIVQIPDAASQRSPISALSSPGSLEGGATPSNRKPQIIAVTLRLPFNHLDTVTLQVLDSGTPSDLFRLATEKVHTMRGAGLDDFEFALDSTLEDLDRVQLTQPCVSTSSSSSSTMFASPRNPFISSSSSPRQPSSLSAPASSLAEQLQQGLKSALGSNRTNLYKLDKAYLLCFLTGPVTTVLDKRATLASSQKSGRAALALRLIHRAEVDLSFQVAQACNQTSAAQTLHLAVQATLAQATHPLSASPSFLGALANSTSDFFFASGAQGIPPKREEDRAFVQYQHLASPGVPFSPPVVFGHGVQLALRCWDSEWSGPLAAPKHLPIGSKIYSYLSLKQRATSGATTAQRDLGLVMAPCEAPFHRTTLITVVPRYILVNRLEVPLEFSQGTSVDASLGVLQPHDETPFHWPWSDKKKQLQVRTASTSGVECQWSGEFPIDAVGELHVKLRKAGSLPNDKRILILRVNIELVQASIMVAFSVQDPEWPPYRVENLTSYPIRYRQTATSLLTGLGTAVGEYDYLPPNASAAYAWDAPTSAVKVLQLEFQQGSRWEQREYGLDGE